MTILLHMEQPAVQELRKYTDPSGAEYCPLAVSCYRNRNARGRHHCSGFSCSHTFSARQEYRSRYLLMPAASKTKFGANESLRNAALAGGGRLIDVEWSHRIASGTVTIWHDSKQDRGPGCRVVCVKFSKMVMVSGVRIDLRSIAASLCLIESDHPLVSTCRPVERRARPRSRLAAGHRRRRRAAVWMAASTVLG